MITNLISNFKQKLKIEIINDDENDLEFDIIGLDCSIANSFRRIMLAEVIFV